jgi:hypothetical protein
MNRWTWIVSAAFSAGLVYLVVDDQSVRAREEIQQLNRDIDVAEDIVAMPTRHPLGKITDVESLLRIVEEQKRLATELDNAFVAEPEVGDQVRQQIRNAVNADNLVRDLNNTSNKKLDFFSTHNFVLTLVGPSKSILAAAQRIKGIALFVSWTSARMSGAGDEAQLQLEFSVYSLIDSTFPPPARVLEVCSLLSTSRVWLPWLSGEIVRLREQRQQLCADSQKDSQHTTAALELDSYSEEWLVRKEILDHLRSKDGTLEATLSDDDAE